MKIALLPRGTGSGHNMRMYSIGKYLRKMDSNVKLEAYIGSLQPVFAPLFQEIGAEVIDLSPKNTVDYSKKSNLSIELDWNNVMDKFMIPLAFDSPQILKLVNLLRTSSPDVVVSDYNFNAITAATILGIPTILVTERYNFTITNVDDNSLEDAGFNVNRLELENARQVLHSLYSWAVSNCSYILTDRPFVESMDKDTIIEELFQSKKMKFVGPMIREIDMPVDVEAVRDGFGVTRDEYLIVAAIGGTCMFRENAIEMQQTYIKAFKEIKKQKPNARMILIAREKLEVPEGIICLEYIPDWIALLKSCDMIVAHPGWITVTEVSAIGIPAIYVLSSPKEFHEFESYKRLEQLGYYVHQGFNSIELANKIIALADPAEVKKLKTAYKAIAPHANGSKLAAEYILQVARDCERQEDITKAV